MNHIDKLSEIKTEPNIGNRILAGIIDYVIILVFTIGYIYTVGEPNDEGGYSVTGLPALLPILFWGFMTVGIEQGFVATLGNLIAGLEPISIRGFNNDLTFVQSLKRHLFDPIDMFFFRLIGIVIIQKTDRNQRVGDIWAETIVVRKTRNKL